MRKIGDTGAKLCVNENWIGSFSLVGWNKTHSWEGDMMPIDGLDFKVEDLSADAVYELEFEYEKGRRLRADIRITKIKPGRIYFEGINPLPEVAVE